MKADALLINKPKLQRPVQRTLFGLITLLAWMAWVSLWLPLITLVVWLLGFRTGYIEVFTGSHERAWHALLQIAALVSLCAVVTASWATYNWWRFRRIARRSNSRRVVPLPAMAKALKISQNSAVHLRESTRITLIFNADGYVVHDRNAIPFPQPEPPLPATGADA